jgi:hypothetical protein
MEVFAGVRAKIAFNLFAHVLTNLVRRGLLTFSASILVFILIFTIIVGVLIIATGCTASAVCII